uniref:non-specific serine/threonine protein kinase n=1 Tax=Nymphaea colorata TaxID=210225 RepID=A0A5K1HM92_9MAGN|nr:unnamed protein product [Nymphaea colorata]
MGRGTFGAVWKVIDHDTRSTYAMKVIDKVRVIANKCIKATVTEKLILAHLSEATNPFIVKLHAAFQDHRHLYLLMDFIEGDSLRNYLIRGLSLPETDISMN